MPYEILHYVCNHNDSNDFSSPYNHKVLNKKKSKSSQDIFMCTIIIKFPFFLTLCAMKINYHERKKRKKEEKLCNVRDDGIKINFTIHNQESSHDCLG